jgi:hypothetical protein
MRQFEEFLDRLRAPLQDQAVPPARFVVSSVSTVAGLVSFSPVGPTVCRIAGVDPALEAFSAALAIACFESLGRMWFLTFRDRNR